MNVQETLVLRALAMAAVAVVNFGKSTDAHTLCDGANLVYSWLGSSEPPTPTGEL